MLKSKTRWYRSAWLETVLRWWSLANFGPVAADLVAAFAVHGPNGIRHYLDTYSYLLKYSYLL
ncbi:MAG TPA: hypothetical protein VGS80_18765, partial [Ktedonobacterales bacterium]|nr:hypothetical protein [Ktedonobacterales bacterium]